MASTSGLASMMVPDKTTGGQRRRPRSSRHGDVDVEIEELALLPAPCASRVLDVLLEIRGNILRDLHLHGPAPSAGAPNAKNERRVPRTRRQRGAIRSSAWSAVLLEVRALISTEALLENKQVGVFVPGRSRPHAGGADCVRAELHDDALRIDFGVGLHHLQPWDVHEVRLPRRARPLLHERELRALELRDGYEEELHVLVLQLLHLLKSLEEERGLAVGERHDGTLCLFSALEEQQVLRQREGLGHVGKTLLELHRLDRRLHLCHVTGHPDDRLGARDGVVRHDLSVAELHDPNLHVLVSVVHTHVPVEELGYEILEDAKTVLLNRATAVNRHDEVLPGNADLVSVAVVGVALPRPVPLPRVRLRACAGPPLHYLDPPPPLLEATVARGGARRPLRDPLEPAVAVAAATPARPALLGGVAGHAAVVCLKHDAPRPALHATVAVRAALPPAGPLGHHAVLGALDLVALPLRREEGAREAELVRRVDDVACDRLPAAASIWVLLVRALVVALLGASLRHPISDLAVHDFLRGGGLAELHHRRAQREV